MVGCKVAPGTRTRRVACSITASTYALDPSNKSTATKSQAKIASAWDAKTPPGSARHHDEAPD
ncbi:hypothetical protein ABH920_007294 [Catenulispora sp. EB89]|uniref:hypothetical protein n=1 Tax=Catenulispora sp. EB89 TaxID=3156257 RepID=UPI003518828E